LKLFLKILNLFLLFYFMDIVKIIKRVERDSDVKKIIAQGFFLGSCFFRKDRPKELIIHFYNPKTNTITDVFVTMDQKIDIMIGEETPAINEMTKIDIEKIRVSERQALEKVKESGVEILMTLHNKKIRGQQKLVWTINVLKQSLFVVTYEIDANSDEIIERRESSLIESIR